MWRKSVHVVKMKIPVEEFFREKKTFRLKTYTNRYLLGLFINKGYFKYTTGFTEMCNQTFAEMCKQKAEEHMRNKMMISVSQFY